MKSDAPVRPLMEESASAGNEQIPPREELFSTLDRRWFLGQLGIGAASLAGLRATASAASATDLESAPTKNIGPALGSQTRRSRAFEVRMRAAELARDRQPALQTPNGEEALYEKRIASYSKGLPHNALGEVDPAAYGAFLAALASADPAAFERLPMGLGRKLTNPLAGMAFDLEGAILFPGSALEDEEHHAARSVLAQGRGTFIF